MIKRVNSLKRLYVLGLHGAIYIILLTYLLSAGIRNLYNNAITKASPNEILVLMEPIF